MARAVDANATGVRCCAAARVLLGAWLTIAPLLLAAQTGCSTTRWVSLRSSPRNPLSDTLGLVARTGPKPTPRTVQLLRRYDLEKKQGDKAALLTELAEINRQEPNRENVYALAELAYVGAKRADAAMQREEALELYGSAVVYSYQYLFDKDFPEPNQFDPQFRSACDLYNAALEATLRIAASQGALRPGATRIIKTANSECEVKIVLQSKGWHAEDFDHVEFVSDYEVHGLRNHYHNFGLGVPLIAVRRHHEDMDPREEYYPPDLSFPVTAFLRMEPGSDRASDATTDGVVAASAQQGGGAEKGAEPAKLSAVLEFHDPLENTNVVASGCNAPLETDLSTPLAYFLSQPAFDDNKVSTLGLLHPEKAEQLQGLYMLEPFQSDKIPVVMVHGLWSSPVTWMEMFNDLRSDPAIRKNYQFWFYMYPSGQPFWFSAARMRQDLAQMRAGLDPKRQSPALDQMVLVGHSMGGLVSKLQTVDSGNEFWKTLSEKPFAEMQADPDVRQGLADAFFFDPNPSIRRVVTIGTPHRGSEFSNDFTAWVGRKLIDVPSKIMTGRSQLVARNPDYFLPTAPLNVTNAIDSLSPKSTILPVLLTAPTGPWVRYHNIVGQAPNRGVSGAVTALVAGHDDGDGVVTLASAQLDTVASQLVVPADHSTVHRHPAAILEVRKILMQHLVDLQSFPYGGGVEYASSTNQPPALSGEAPLIQLPMPTSPPPSDAEVSIEEVR